MRLMKRWFAGYNGRYLGNLLALLITRSTFWKAMVPALCMALLLAELECCWKVGLQKLSDGRQLFLLLATVFLLTAVPRTLYAQSYGWLAAFVNFVPPVLLFLIYFHHSLAMAEYAAAPPSLPVSLLYLPLAFATQLFAEHVTLIALLYAVVILIYTRVRRSRFYACQLLYLIGSVGGAVMMFSNSAYHNAAVDTEGYKHIGFSAADMISQLRDRIMEPLCLNNVMLNILLVVVLLTLMTRSRRRSPADLWMAMVLCGFAVYNGFHRLYPSWTFVQNEAHNKTIQLFLCVIFFLHVLWCLWRHARRKVMCCVLWMSAALAAAPLLAASPIGPRCFYFSYVLMVLTVLMVLAELMETQTGRMYIPCAALLAVTASLCIIYLRMFYAIGAADHERAGRIEQAKAAQATELTLPYLPYSEYYWTTVPTDKKWASYFKKFYKIPKKVKVTFQ